MDRTNTLTDIARRAGLSVGTVFAYMHRRTQPTGKTRSQLDPILQRAGIKKNYQWQHPLKSNQ